MLRAQGLEVLAVPLGMRAGTGQSSSAVAPDGGSARHDIRFDPMADPAPASRFHALLRDPIESLTAPWGSIELFLLPRACVLQRATGRGTIEMAEAIERGLRKAMQRCGTVRVFDDWQRVNGYDSRARVSLTQFTRKHKADISETHILVGSKLLAMGISVASLALGRTFQVYSNRARFEDVLEGAVYG